MCTFRYTQTHTHTHLSRAQEGRRGPLKLLSDAQSEMDPGKTKGHDERPLDFSAVLFPRHTLTLTLSVTSQTRPWHLGHLSAGSASLRLSRSLTGWHGTEWSDVDGTRTKKFVLFAVTSEMDAGVISPFPPCCSTLLSRSKNKILSCVYSELFFPLPGSCLSHFITVVWSLVWEVGFSNLHCFLFRVCNDLNLEI